MCRICIFDLDGTLTDTLDSMTLSVNQTLGEMGLCPVTRGQCRSFVGNGARYLMERALAAAGGDAHLRIGEAMEIYGRVFAQNCMYHVKPYPGIPELLAGLAERGTKLAVLSNKPHGQAVDVVETVFGRQSFAAVQGQCDTFPRKPSPAPVFELVRRLGGELSDCICIGDSEVDIETGAAAGVRTIGVTWGFRTAEELRRAGARETADSPIGLGALLGIPHGEMGEAGRAAADEVLGRAAGGHLA